MSNAQNRLDQWRGLLTHYDRLPPRSATSREPSAIEASRRYTFLASWSNAARWKVAAGLFCTKLCWAQIFRTPGSVVIWDSRDGLTGATGVTWDEIEQ